MRTWFLNNVREMRLENAPFADWLECPLDQFLKDMRVGDSGNRNKWGGFLGAACLTEALREQGVSILMLDMRDDGFLAITWTAPAVRDPEHIVCLAWMGAHWQRARLRPEGWKILFESWKMN